MAHELACDRVDTQRGGARTGAHQALRAPTAEEQSDAVIERPASGQDPGAHAREPRRQALGLAIGVNGQRALEQPQAFDRSGPAARAGHAALEPAHRTGAQPCEHRAAPPCLEQQAVESVRPPYRKQVAHRPSAHVDDVLCEDGLAQGAPGVPEAEQREMFGDANAVGKACPEGVDLRVRVARGRRQEEDARLLGARETEDEVVEQRVRGLHREAAAAHREDRPVLHRRDVRAAHTASGRVRANAAGANAGEAGAPPGASAGGSGAAPSGPRKAASSRVSTTPSSAGSTR